MTDARTAEPTVLTDALGRKISIRKLNALQQLRLYKAMGPTNASNEPYGNMAECAAMVASIDGSPRMLPSTEKHIEELVKELGHEGLATVMAHRMNEMRAVMEAAEAAMRAAGEDGEQAEAAAPLATSG